MEAREIDVRERASASRKLGEREARALLAGASRLIAAKGKRVDEFRLAGRVPREAVEAMLGPTGNLRAPTVRVGTTLLVGFDEEAYRRVLG